MFLMKTANYFKYICIFGFHLFTLKGLKGFLKLQHSLVFNPLLYSTEGGIGSVNCDGYIEYAVCIG